MLSDHLHTMYRYPSTSWDLGSQTGRRTDAFALAGKEKQNGIQTREADGSSLRQGDQVLRSRRHNRLEQR